MASSPAAAAPVASPIGRADELGIAAAYLTAGFAASERRLVVLDGPAGIGKSTVWRSVVAAIGAGGARTLTAGPAAVEADLAYAGLADLLAAVPDEALGDLPSPQRRALGVATLREEPDDRPLDLRTVGTALISLVRGLAADHPVLVAVDDAQWLDAASGRALSFALRRLAGAPVGVLLATRTEESSSSIVNEVEAALPSEVRRRLELGPLTTGALFQMLRDRLGHAFGRPTLVRIAEWSGGNPLFAIELGRLALRAGGVLGPEPPAGLPASVTDAMTARLSTLTLAQIRTVLLVACSPGASEAELDVAAAQAGWSLELPDDPSILRRDGGRFRTGHPLIASQALAVARPADRRTAHRALATVTPDAISRARHLALAAEGASSELAESLDLAARVAVGRGATEAAIDLATLACDRTPPADLHELLARRRALGELLLSAGETRAAGDVLRSAAAMEASGPERALAKVALAEVASHGDGLDAAARLCAEAAAEVGDDPSVAGRVELEWSGWSADAREGLSHARRAVALLADGPLELRTRSLANLVASLSEVGEVVPQETLDEALRLEAAAPPRRLLAGASATQAWLSLLADELATAHLQYDALRQRATDLGDESALAWILVNLAQIDLRWGHWLELETHAREAIDVAERAGLERFRMLGILQLGALAAARGDRPVAERYLREVEAFGRDGGHAFIEAAAAGNLGTLALGEGRFEEALGLLEHAAIQLGDVGIADMALGRFQGDRLEALVALGRLEAAAELAGILEAESRRNDRRRPIAMVRRGQGLVAAARGDPELAIEQLTESVRTLDALDMPFEAARSRLARAAVHRRRRAKALADEDLAAAEQVFAALGATRWERRARSERGRLGLRPHAPLTLTDTEIAVATLAADGLTSREIAATAFMSPRTVEGVLARVYAKLGIRSRAELGAAMASRQHVAGRAERTAH